MSHTPQDELWIQRSGLFAAAWYLANNRDVAASGINPLTHWCTFGHREGRDPNPSFSVRDYRMTHPDCTIAHNPLLHSQRAQAHAGIADHRIRAQQLRGRMIPPLTPSGALVIPSEILDSNAVKRIALIKLDHIGDIYLAFPAINRIAKSFPKAQLTIYCASFAIPIFRRAGYNDCIALDVFPPGGVSHSGVRTDLTVTAGDYDLAVDLRVERDARHVLFSVGARLTAAFDVIADYHLPYPGIDIPHSTQLLLLADRIPAIPLTPIGAAQKKQRRVLLSVSGSVTAKRWPSTSWIELGRLLKRCGHLPEVIGAPEDMSLAREIAIAAGIPWRPSVQLADFADWVVANCDVYIGVDTGMTHAVAMLGHSVVEVIGGYTNLLEWVASGPNVIALHRSVPCSPCFSPNQCPNEWHCLQIPPQDVLWAIECIPN